jgi:hypothetical protein
MNPVKLQDTKSIQKSVSFHTSTAKSPNEIKLIILFTIAKENIILRSNSYKE